MSEDKIKDLEKLNQLLAEKARLLEQINALESKVRSDEGPSTEKHGKKRSREKGKKKRKEKSTKERKRAKKISLQSDRTVTVTNPVSGKKIKIGGGKGRQNKAFKAVLRNAAKEGWAKTGRNTNAVVEMIAEAQKQGITWWDYNVVPSKVQRWAARMSGVNIREGDHGDEFSESSPSDYEGRFEEQGEFKKQFKVWRMKMNPPDFVGKMEDDLAKAQTIVSSHLRFIKRNFYKDTPFTFYLTYRFIMERHELRNRQGNLVGLGERDSVEIASNNTHPIRTVRPLSKVDDEIGAAISDLMYEFSNIEQTGSGWSWEESVYMDIYVARKVDRLAISSKEGTAQKAVEKRNKGKEKEKEKEKEAEEESEEEEEEELEESRLKGGGYIKEPRFIVNPHKRLFNPQPRAGLNSEEEHMCFSWCILRALYPDGVRGYERSNEMYNYSERNIMKPGYKKMGNVGDLYHAIEDGVIQHVILPKGVEYPVPIDPKVFEKVEDLNDISLSVFVAGKSEDDPVSPFFASRKKSQDRPHVRLLLLQKRKVEKLGQSVLGRFLPDSYDFHFTLITNLNLLVKEKGDTSQTSKWNYCENCLNRFGTVAKLQDHERYCLHNEATRYTLPKGDKKYIRFKKFNALQKHPVVIYADFEAINADYYLTRPVEEGRGKTVSKAAKGEAYIPQEGGNTKPVSIHQACGFAYQIIVAKEYREVFDSIKGWRGKPFNEIRSYVGADTLITFYNAITEDARLIIDKVRSHENVIPTEESVRGRAAIAKADKCCICRQLLPTDEELEEMVDPNLKRRDPYYDPFNGRFKGVCHYECGKKIDLRKGYVVPCFFHNLKGYDSYHLIRGLDEVAGNCRIDVIAKSMEKYTAITLNKSIKFVDSLQFMKASLEELTRNLYNSLKTKEQMLETFWPVARWKFFDQEEDIAQYLKKGVYPYELAKSIKDLFTIKEIPPREAFTSKLRGGAGITVGEYKRANWAWEKFKCVHLADYTDAYCQLDVLLLASVMESFRATSCDPDAYGLDPAHFITAPALSWNARLLRDMFDGNVLETFTDNDVGMEGMNMVERGIRGGMCQVLHPYAQGDALGIEDVEGVENPPREVKVLYVDENNLYGAGMSGTLPHSDFQFDYTGVEPQMTKEEREQAISEIKDYYETQDEEGMFPVKKPPNLLQLVNEMETKMMWRSNDMDELSEFIQGLDVDGERGYLLEVDLEYPKELHDLHNDLPFCPTNKAPPDPSAYTRFLFRKHGFSSENIFKMRKLILDLTDKKNYVCHFAYLQLALKHGLKLVKVHRVMSFKQSKWLKTYVDFNTKKRTTAKNSVEKDFFKLMVNSIFGKMIENIRKQRDIRLLRQDEWGKAVKYASHPWMKAWRIIVPDKLIAIERMRGTRCMDRPIIVGQAILDLSKVIMYDLWYQKIMPHFIVDVDSPLYRIDGPKIQKRVRALYTDTDSIVLEIVGEPGKSVYRDLYELQKAYDLFDFSEVQDADKYPLLSYQFEEGVPPLKGEMMKNSKQLYKIKDEMKGIPIAEFCALQSKTYSVLLHGDLVMKHHNKKKADMGKIETKSEIAKKKGIPSFLQIQHEKYKQAFMGKEREKVEYAHFDHTKDMILRTVFVSKASIATLDTKSYYLNAITLLRYGHYKIEEWKNWLEECANDHTYYEFVEEEDKEDWEKTMDEEKNQALEGCKELMLIENQFLEEELWEKEKRLEELHLDEMIVESYQ